MISFVRAIVEPGGAGTLVSGHRLGVLQGASVVETGGDAGRAEGVFAHRCGNVRPLPTVAVFPMECFGCHWSCQYKPEAGDPAPCVTNITVEEVWNKTLTLITNGLNGTGDF